MKTLFTFKPPFNTFLIATLQTERILTIETNKMDGSVFRLPHRRADIARDVQIEVVLLDLGHLHLT